jgi:hypothetical protein
LQEQGRKREERWEISLVGREEHSGVLVWKGKEETGEREIEREMEPNGDQWGGGRKKGEKRQLVSRAKAAKSGGKRVRSDQEKEEEA